MIQRVNFAPISANKKALFWLIQFMIIGLFLLYRQLNTPLQLNADLAGLFNTQQQAQINQISKQIEQQSLNQQIILIASESIDKAIVKADELAAKLNKLPLVEKAQTQFNDFPTLDDIINDYLPYKQYLLSEKMQSLLDEGDVNKIFSYQFSLLNQVANQTVPLTIEEDPTLSLADYLSRPLASSAGLSLQNNHLVARYQNKYYVLLSFSHSGSSINIDAAQQLTQQIKQLTSESEVEYIYTGAIFYSSQASLNGQHEMLLYGGISLLATLLLIILIYRNLLALLATLSLLAISFTYGYLALSLIYTQINVITLVFSITLVGIAADYSFHALTELKFTQYQASNGQTNSQALSTIYPSLSMSFVTTGAGYSLLLLAPFILFQQIAVFTLFGLFGALITVLLLYPALLPLIQKNSKSTIPSTSKSSMPAIILSIHHFQNSFIRFIQKYKVYGLGCIFICVPLVSLIQFNDDVRDYYTPDQQLKAQEEMIKTILKSKWDLQYFLVQADSEQALLEKEEQLLNQLQPLLKQGELNAISAISQWLPSIKQQQYNRELINQTLKAGKFDQMQTLITQSNWQVSPNQAMLKPEDWRVTHLGKIHQQQWLQKDQNFYSVVRLSGINNLTTLNRIGNNINQVYFVDKAQQISSQLNHFRQQLFIILVAAIIAAVLVFCWRYGLQVALLGLTTPILALTIALATSTLLQDQLNIFNLVAGILILALGLDYSVFYAEHGLEKKITLTTLMSALSSIFVFAILTLSSMPAIRSFGLTVFTGVLLTFILAPIVTMVKKAKTS